MGEIEKDLALDNIQAVVREIVERFNPHKVVLFGSCAEGEPSRDSDVDLLVVMETEEPALHAAARIAGSIDHPFPLDILVTTPSAFDASLRRKGTFAVEVATKGVVLYEA